MNVFGMTPEGCKSLGDSEAAACAPEYVLFDNG